MQPLVGQLGLQNNNNPSLVEPLSPGFAFWVINALLVLLVLLVLVLCWVLVGYKHWLGRDNHHKAMIERHLELISEALERLADGQAGARENLPQRATAERPNGVVSEATVPRAPSVREGERE